MSYAEKREILITYLQMKVEQEDWHGAADAACDLRELDAFQRGIDMTEKRLHLER